MGQVLQLANYRYQNGHVQPGCLGVFVEVTEADFPYAFVGLGTERLAEARLFRCASCGAAYLSEVFERELLRGRLRAILSRPDGRLRPEELKFLRALTGLSMSDFGELLGISARDYQVREMLVGGDESVFRRLAEKLLPQF